MFETATLTYGQGSKRVWGTFAGVTGQALLVTCAAIAPMIWPAALPRAAWITGIEAPGPPPAPPPPGETVIRPKTAVRAESQFLRGVLVEPTRVPPRAATLIEEAPAMASAGGVDGGVVGGDQNGVLGGILRSVMSEGSRMAGVVKPPEPVVATPPKSTAAPVAKPPRVSALELAHPISRVDPIYPLLARQMRISGVVELEGVLGTDGRIHEVRALRGHPMLIKAAVDAVRQWTYAPTILNGQAVEVVAPIVVTFRLN